MHGWIFDASFALALAVNVAIVIEGIGRYRNNLDVNERRRIQLVVFSGVPAVFAYAIKAGVPLLSCEMDVRTGGTYRVVFGHDVAEGMAFVGRYLEVVPNARLVWTNEESTDGAVTTVTFEEKDSRTLLTLRDLYPTKEALDEALSGMEEGMPEQFAQLDELLLALAAGDPA